MIDLIVDIAPVIGMLSGDEFTLDPKDVRYDTFGNGSGLHQSVRAIHLPTGITHDTEDYNRVRGRRVVLRELTEKVRQHSERSNS